VSDLNNFEQIKNSLPEWIRVEGEAGDVVFSSRVRLARNLKGIPFPNQATEEQLEQVNREIGRVLEKKSDLGPIAISKVAQMPPVDRMVLIEEHLCSPQFIEEPQQRALAVNGDKSISLMINEEDHLRIQTITPGFSIENAMELANRVDDYLESGLDFCFDEQFGYLTSCPTNAGTGIRASVMVHLPALAMVDQVKRVLSALTHVGINIRGLYGEGTESFGDLYQISNQITMGRSEEELAGNLISISRQVVEQERAVREALAKDSRLQLEDRLCRSYGILTQARMLSAQEALKLFSDVKLGVELGIISGVDKIKLKELIFLSRAAILQNIIGRELAPTERDFYRAQLIREQLT
jgi:protein arginine kinase